VGVAGDVSLSRRVHGLGAPSLLWMIGLDLRGFEFVKNCPLTSPNLASARSVDHHAAMRGTLGRVVVSCFSLADKLGPSSSVTVSSTSGSLWTKWSTGVAIAASDERPGWDLSAPYPILSAIEQPRVLQHHARPLAQFVG
jgi:hypothetical protein